MWAYVLAMSLTFADRVADSTANANATKSNAPINCSPKSSFEGRDAQTDTQCVGRLRDEAVTRIKSSLHRARENQDPGDFKRRVEQVRFWMCLAQAQYHGPYSGRGASAPASPTTGSRVVWP